MDALKANSHPKRAGAMSMCVCVQGVTPLKEATKASGTQAVQLLLSKGGDAAAADDEVSHTDR